MCLLIEFQFSITNTNVTALDKDPKIEIYGHLSAIFYGIKEKSLLNLKEEKYASENFQVMNYGIGGKITCHLDSSGKSKLI